MNKCFLSLATAGLLAAGGADAAVISLINVDPDGVGLNDATPTRPVGGNPGITIGEQRRIAYQFAMDLWGSVLQSEVEIKVYASFAPLACTAGSGTLAQAGTNWIVYNTPNARPNTLYHSALADALAGEDIVPDPDDPGDIFSQFNGSMGRPDCLAGLSWYYGLDGKTPQGTINFLNVVMHELGHGLGMSGFINKSTGSHLAGIPDIYTVQALDNATGLSFVAPAMTNATRAAAMRTPGRTVWNGAEVNAQAALVLDAGRNMLRVTAPAAASGTYEYGVALFGPAVSPASFPARDMVLVDDGVAPAGASTTDGCDTPFANAAAVAGKIAVVDRGTCGFAVKVRNAQLNGAAAVVVVNNTAGVIDMANAAPPFTDITIPSVMVSMSDGARIKSGLPATGGVFFDQSALVGADTAGRVRLYSPTTVAGGSTFSHFDTALAPNALMEPFDTPEIQAHVNVDLTPAVFQDIGWTLNPAGGRIGKCDSSVDAVEEGGIIIGANVAAQSGVCQVQAAGSKPAYVKCMTTAASRLRDQKLITSTQFNRIFQCSAFQR
ncbi:PA domain-containing protein [Lysobacter sp. N42]|uniref:PA domain-containing protein n=1 Tax=Lysobacter sp. N42 TaxID=2545719 RepID=UPI001FB803F4|nr:PA domain-containing protein [Lysobacter sp. N42]